MVLTISNQVGRCSLRAKPRLISPRKYVPDGEAAARLAHLDGVLRRMLIIWVLSIDFAVWRYERSMEIVREYFFNRAFRFSVVEARRFLDPKGAGHGPQKLYVLVGCRIQARLA